MFDPKFKFIVVGLGLADHGVRHACPEGGCPRGALGAEPGDPTFKDGYEPIQPTDMKLPNLMGAVDFDSELDARSWLTSSAGKDFLYQYSKVGLVRSHR